MFELASAVFSIADANEFRFARFYIVCEAVPLGTPESPLIVCGLSGTLRGMSKRGRDTEWNTSRRMEEIREFCFKKFAAVWLFRNFLFSVLPVILLITTKDTDRLQQFL